VALGTVDLGPPSPQTTTPLARGEGPARKMTWTVAAVVLLLFAAAVVLTLARK
jgi:hypothetical protein